MPARSLSQHVADELQQLAVETTGERIIFLSSLGSTETAPAALACSWESERTGNIGLPLPRRRAQARAARRQARSAAQGRQHHARLLAAPQLTAEAFDDEGFYKIGDALKFADPTDPAKGLLFDGRLAEDFKLATGTWVSVGPLRAAFIAHCAPLVRDVVLAGADRDDIAALVFPDLDACRKLAPDLAGRCARRRRARRSARARRIRAPARRARAAGHRHVEPHLPRHPAGRTAVARHRRNDRQGLDQPARGACPSRRSWSKSFTPTRRRRTSSSPTAANERADHGHPRTCRDRHRRRLRARRRDRAHAGRGRRQGGDLRRQPEGRRRGGERHQRHRDRLRRHQRRAPEAAFAKARRRSRHGAHPDQLRRHRPGQAHRRPRRADAARRFRARHRDQPDRHVQRDAACRRRHAESRAAAGRRARHHRLHRVGRRL